MARRLRLEYPGAFYHVMARGNRREAIFEDQDDRRYFLKVISEACERTGWRIHAWVLMGNHYHLLIETPEPNLVEGMKWVQNTYTRRFNVRHRAWGRVFGDRYKAVIVEGEQAEYYSRVVDYLHLNPVRAGLVDVDAGGSVLDYKWSSVAGGYALPAPKRANWLAATDGLRRLGFPDTVAGRRSMVESLDRRAMQEREDSGLVAVPKGFDARISHLRQGWYWGSEGFAEKLRAMLKSKLNEPKSRAYQRSPQRLAHDMKRAEDLANEGLQVAGLAEKELAGLKGSDPRKVELARVIRQNTTASLGWISQRLEMKSAANVSQQLRTTDAASLRRKLPNEFAAWLKRIDAGVR